MPIPDNRALVPYRPFMTVRAADFHEEPAELRTYASREACENDLFAWISESVIPNEVSGGSYNPGHGWYTFASYENGEIRHQRREHPEGLCYHFGPWAEDAFAASTDNSGGPWPF